MVDSAEFLFHKPELVNLIGHSAGAVLFGIFLSLLIRDRRGSRLSWAAAGLAFAWDVLSLLTLMTPGTAAVLVPASFSALSLLPAVLLHICLPTSPRLLVRMGYGVASCAALLHWIPGWHARALWLVTVGMAVLTLAALPLSLRQSRAGSRQLIATMSLLLFALSLTHLADWPSDEDWRFELLLHHASIPLALFILLQDFRFLLLDAFVRVVANFALAGVMALAVARVATAGPLWLWIMGAALVFGFVRPFAESALARLLFPRPSSSAAMQALKQLAAQVEAEQDYLREAHAVLAAHMNAAVVPQGDAPADLRQPAVIAGPAAEVAIPLRYANGDHQTMLLGRRGGGRRYLSEDLQELSMLAGIVVEHVEELRAREMKRLVAQAELRALEAQIHPHFLFNALNTLYGVIPRQAADARRLVLNLADIFRYFLQVEKTYIPLEEEIRIVEAYLEIEMLRMGPKLRKEIDIDPRVSRELIPILTIEPLVENAVKHGVAARSGEGFVRVRAALVNEAVEIEVADSGPGFGAVGASVAGAGVGLDNVRRRLRLCYGGASELRTVSDGATTRVGFSVPLAALVENAR